MMCDMTNDAFYYNQNAKRNKEKNVFIIVSLSFPWMFCCLFIYFDIKWNFVLIIKMRMELRGQQNWWKNAF